MTPTAPTNDNEERWQQRYRQFAKAFQQLDHAVTLANSRPLSDLEQQGLIQAFEFTHELAWKSVKDFLESRGVTQLYGSKDSTRAAFQRGLIEDGEVWMQMIKSRNLSSHTYNEAIAADIVADIQNSYHAQFQQLLMTLGEFIYDASSN
jgi:nucleotidyltransferase substrate binding protein (TIGR01987 family)